MSKIYDYPVGKEGRAEALKLREKLINEGKAQPLFKNKDGDFFRFMQRGKSDSQGYKLENYNNRLKNISARRANKLNLTPTLDLYIKVFGKELGPHIFDEELAKVDKVFAGVDPTIYDVDHLGSLKYKNPNMARNLSKQLIKYNRSEGARDLTKYQQTSLRVVPDDLETTIKLQGPDLNELQKNQILNRINFGATKDYTGISAFAANQSNEYQTQFTSKKVNNGNGNGTNGNGTNGKNGNGLTVNGKNGKNGFLKSLENVKDYSGITKFGRNADQLANIGVNVSTGNYGGAAIGAATYGTSKALQDPKVQARVAKQITQLVAERGAKSAAKFLPGLDVVLSGKESWDYLKRGRWDQAGIAALSGAIGWIPLIGDGASAALDLSNTGIDIARLQAPTGANKKKSQNRLTRFLKGLNT